MSGRVHSVFRRVINVQDDDGELFTVASRDLDNAPNTLILDTGGFAPACVARGDRVHTLDGELAIGHRIRIRLDGAAPWDPPLPAYPADDSRIRRNLEVLRPRIGPHGIGGLSSSGASASAFASGMAATLKRHAAALGAALCAGDVEAACAQAAALVGLGPGLTPSGDDFLVGLLAVLHLPDSPCRGSMGLCEHVVVDLQRRTNAISAAALKAAAQGRFREVIQALLRELMTGTPERLATALARVLAIGSTSGTDMAAGILCGFEASLQLSSGNLKMR